MKLYPLDGGNGVIVRLMLVEKREALFGTERLTKLTFISAPLDSTPEPRNKFTLFVTAEQLAEINGALVTPLCVGERYGINLFGSKATPIKANQS